MSVVVTIAIGVVVVIGYLVWFNPRILVLSVGLSQLLSCFVFLS